MIRKHLLLFGLFFFGTIFVAPVSLGASDQPYDLHRALDKLGLHGVDDESGKLIKNGSDAFWDFVDEEVKKKSKEKKEELGRDLIWEEFQSLRQEVIEDITEKFSDPKNRPKYLVRSNQYHVMLRGDQRDVTLFIQKFITGLTFLAGAIAIFFIINNCFVLVTAAGDSDKITKGRKGLIWSGVGLLLIVFSYIIVKTVISLTYSGEITQTQEQDLLKEITDAQQQATKQMKEMEEGLSQMAEKWAEELEGFYEKMYKDILAQIKIAQSNIKDAVSRGVDGAADKKLHEIKKEMLEEIKSRVEGILDAGTLSLGNLEAWETSAKSFFDVVSSVEELKSFAEEELPMLAEAKKDFLFLNQQKARLLEVENVFGELSAIDVKTKDVNVHEKIVKAKVLATRINGFYYDFSRGTNRFKSQK